MRNPTLATIVLVQGTPDLVSDVTYLLTARPEISLLQQEDSDNILITTSPTQAVLECEEFLKTKTLSSTSDLKVFIDTADIGPSAEPHNPIIEKARQTLENLPCGFYLSPATRLTIQESEISPLGKVRKWKTFLPTTVAYRISHVEDELLLSHSTADAQISHLQRYRPASFEKRASAMCIDYIIALSMIFFYNFVSFAPKVFKVWSSRKRIEAENTNSTHGRISPIFFASGGQTLRLKSPLKMSTAFPFTRDTYEVYLIARIKEEIPKIKLTVNGKVVPGAKLSAYKNNFYQSPIANQLELKPQDLIEVQILDQATSVEVDYLYFVAPNDHRYPFNADHQTFFGKDVIMALGLWHYQDLLEPIGLVVVTAGSLFILMQTFFLTFFNFTPGCLASGVRIVQTAQRKRLGGVLRLLERIRKIKLSKAPGTTLLDSLLFGDRDKAHPGLFRALLRSSATPIPLLLISVRIFAALIPLSILGWLWPLISRYHYTWADIISGTRLVEQDVHE